MLSPILLLQEDDGACDAFGHGAAILSFRSQVKLIPENGSNVASDGKLGRRHPDSSAENAARCYQTYITQLNCRNCI